MRMTEALNKLARELGHGHALDNVPDETVSIWQLQADWRKRGKTRNLFYYAMDMPYLCGMEGWREEKIDDGKCLVHVTGTGRMKIRVCEIVHGTELRQDLYVELWAGGDEPRMVVTIHGVANVRLAVDGNHTSDDVWLHLYSDRTTPEDTGDRVDRLEYMLWLNEHVAPIVGAEKLLALIEANAEELARTREEQEVTS